MAARLQRAPARCSAPAAPRRGVSRPRAVPRRETPVRRECARSPPPAAGAATAAPPREDASSDSSAEALLGALTANTPRKAYTPGESAHRAPWRARDSAFGARGAAAAASAARRGKEKAPALSHQSVCDFPFANSAPLLRGGVCRALVTRIGACLVLRARPERTPSETSRATHGERLACCCVAPEVVGWQRAFRLVPTSLADASPLPAPRRSKAGPRARNPTSCRAPSMTSTMGRS